MPKDENVFERPRDMLRDDIVRVQGKLRQAFGAGKRPYDAVRLPKGQQRDYWNWLSQTDPAKAKSLWDQMDDAERAELGG